MKRRAAIATKSAFPALYLAQLEPHFSYNLFDTRACSTTRYIKLQLITSKVVVNKYTSSANILFRSRL